MNVNQPIVVSRTECWGVTEFLLGGGHVETRVYCTASSRHTRGTTEASERRRGSKRPARRQRTLREGQNDESAPKPGRLFQARARTGTACRHSRLRRLACPAGDSL